MMCAPAFHTRTCFAGFVILLQLVMISAGRAQTGANDFSYHAPGSLVPSGSGQGRTDRKIYLPGILFPVEIASDQASFPNSQVYGVGGEFGPGGNLCSDKNYQMPWSDTYCEKRDWGMPMCPSGKGHQGDDIRGPTCEDNKWNVVAVENGKITRVSAYPIIYLKGDSGTLYRYMHVHPQSVQVQANQQVTAGTVLARISNWMNGQPNQTSMHVHFDASQNVPIGGTVKNVNVPVYTSLVVAYRKAKGLPPMDSGGQLQVDPQREK